VFSVYTKIYNPNTHIHDLTFSWLDTKKYFQISDLTQWRFWENELCMKWDSLSHIKGK